MKKEDVISVLVATDDNGCKWLAPLLVSIMKTTHTFLDVYVFCKKLSQENEEILNKVVYSSKIKLEFIEMTSNFDFYVPKKWPLPALFRLKADSVLSHLDKIIYLDIDTLVYKNLKELWKIDLGDSYLGACWGMDKNRKLGVMDPENKITEYFNSGVLLMNLKKMRKDNIGQKCLDFMKDFKDHLQAVDQDALNVVCVGKIKPLSVAWNWYVSIARRNQKKLKNIFKVYYSKTPAIIHYYSQYKPHRLFVYIRHPLATYRVYKYQKFFWECVKETPYKIKREIKVQW